MLDLILSPWPWYISGPAIGLIISLIYWLESKPLGVSSSLPYFCEKIYSFNQQYLQGNSKNSWQGLFVLGLFVGSGIYLLMHNPYIIDINPDTVNKMQALGFSHASGFVPPELYSTEFSSWIILFIGGMVVGFGARYANGCTAGHAISGVARFAPSSILSTVGFFLGGLAATHIILPGVLS